MNGAHWHLVTNHFPIILPIVGIVLLVSGILIKSEILKRAAYFSFIVGSIATMVVFTGGESAEEVVENIEGIDEKFIKVHEEAAETFAILMYLLGAISIAGLWANWQKKSYATIFAVATIVFTVIVLFYAKETGTTGGEIRHTEIRNDGTTENPALNQANAEEEDDD